MTYAEYKNARRDLVNESLRLFAKGNKRALKVGAQRVLGLKDHYRHSRSAA